MALDQLGTRCGAIVALEPKTGRVLVMASSPPYNPNLVEQPGGWRKIARTPADCSPPAALLNRATYGLYAPGSTFKVVTAAAALESGRFKPDSTFYDPGYCEEYGKSVNNYDTTSPFGTVNLPRGCSTRSTPSSATSASSSARPASSSRPQRFGFYSRPPLETPADERTASGLYGNGKLIVPKEAGRPTPGGWRSARSGCS